MLPEDETPAPSKSTSAMIPGARRTRHIRQACTVCKDRKVKCDRAEPSCGRCVRLNEACTYNSLGRANLPRQVQQLQARLARAEERLALADHLPLIEAAPATEKAGQMAFLAGSVPEGVSLNEQIQTPAENSLSLLDEYLQGLGSFNDEYQNDISMNQQPWTEDASSLLNWPFDHNPPDPSPITPIPQKPDGNPTSDISEEGSLSNDLKVLHAIFFNFVYHSLPMLCQERFTSELSLVPHSPSVLALSYAIALVAAAFTPRLSHRTEPCYALARKYLEACETEDEAIGSLNVFQALLLVLRYEIMGTRVTRAWMTIGRAARLAHVLDLQRMDGEDTASGMVQGLHLPLPPTSEPVLLEERRRSFWTLFILETYIATRTGMPYQLDPPSTFELYLPSPGLLTSPFSSATVPFLGDIPDHETQVPLSSYAACVLMVELAMRCFSHTSTRGPSARNAGFWDRHYSLVKLLDDRSVLMGVHLSTEAVCEDPIALTTQLSMQAIEIMVHEAAIQEIARQGLPSAPSVESQRCCRAAAGRILETVAAVRALPAEQSIFNLQATFVAWPIAAAIKAFSIDLGSLDADLAVDAADGMRFLFEALSVVEVQGGYWHAHTATCLAKLKDWDAAVINHVL